jgi:hypothetical protein
MRVWTFWPCGCATFPTGYWIVCDDCLIFGEGTVSLLPGLSWGEPY